MRITTTAIIAAALLGAPGILHGAAHAAADAAPVETTSPAPAEELAVPAYIIPTRSFIMPQDEDLPRKDKRRWARPTEPEAPPATEGTAETTPAPALLPE